MFLEFRDTTNQRICSNGPATVIVPSAVTPGDGKCRVVLVNAIAEVTLAEAERVINMLNRKADNGTQP